MLIDIFGYTLALPGLITTPRRLHTMAALRNGVLFASADFELSPGKLSNSVQFFMLNWRETNH